MISSEWENEKIAENPLTERKEAFLDEMRAEVENPQSGDYIMGNFYEAMLDRLRWDGKLIDVVNNYLVSRSELEKSPALQLFFRAYQRCALLIDINYPYYYDTHKWEQTISAIHLNKRLNDIIAEDLKGNVLSTVPDRGKGLAMVIDNLVHTERLEEPPRILDIGSGPLMLLKKLLLKGTELGAVKSTVTKKGFGLNFDPVEVYEALDGFEEDNSQVTEHRLGQLAVNGIFEKQNFISQGVGVDLESYYDKEIQSKRLSHSFRPLELIVDAHRVEEYILINACPLESMPQLLPIKMDILSPEAEKIFNTDAKWDFDIVWASFVMYQFSEEQRERVYGLLKNAVSEKGVIVVQDFVEVDEADPSKLHYYANWVNDWQCRTVIMDMQNQGEWQEAYRWNNGRLNKLIIGDGSLINRRGAAVKISELIFGG